MERIRAGQISCALWENEINVNGTRKTILKASVTRRYQDKNGNWQSAQGFSRNEIPLAVYCLQKAFARMIEQPPKRPDDDVGPVEEIYVE